MFYRHFRGEFMDRLGKEELIRFYRRHLEDFGDSPMAVRWTEKGQRLRYEIILGIMGDVRGKRLLDFGCGKGDFYGFLLEKGIDLSYTGIDINPLMIERAMEKFRDAVFICADIEEEGLQKEHDIVLVCGTFNLRVAGVEDSFWNVLRILYRQTKEALHLNCLSWYRKVRDPELFYIKPEDLTGFVMKELSNKFILRHGLPEGDVFLSVFRGNPG